MKITKELIETACVAFYKQDGTDFYVLTPREMKYARWNMEAALEAVNFVQEKVPDYEFTANDIFELTGEKP